VDIDQSKAWGVVPGGYRAEQAVDIQQQWITNAFQAYVQFIRSDAATHLPCSSTTIRTWILEAYKAQKDVMIEVLHAAPACSTWAGAKARARTRGVVGSCDCASICI
jgi:hypothetical protein